VLLSAAAQIEAAAGWKPARRVAAPAPA
jgi:hypothetical protein